MPQIQKGQVQPGQNGAPDLYGVDGVENSKPFHARLMERFQPHEFVTIKNIDDAPVYWQYMPREKEDIAMTPDGMQSIVTRGEPEMWMIGPGETETLIGASAYMALDAIYKNVAAKKVLKREGITSSYDKENNHTPKNFNFSDGGAQEAFIKQAYLGKAELAFAPVDAPTVDPDTPQSVKSMSDIAKEKELATNATGGKK